VSELGRLKHVNLREQWTSEASDFTPWLAEAENLALLGETIGLELECEAQEKSVGKFKADILCRDTSSGAWVLIENQLERTDHTHLGQLLTYAAGLKAVTVVWVASEFTEEHRAALDWLNEITDTDFNFFGLEIELWCIGESPRAPRFNVISKPNDWSRTIKDVSKGNLSETLQLYLEYWMALKQYLEDTGSSVQMTKPLPQNWMTFPVGKSNFYVTAAVSRQKKRGSVQLVIYGPDHVSYFQLLQRDKEDIEMEVRSALDWRELPNGKESHIRKRFDGLLDLEKREDWTRQHEEFRVLLERFVDCSRPRVKALDLADLQEDESEELGT
jgi:hypothetical protein